MQKSSSEHGCWEVGRCAGERYAHRQKEEAHSHNVSHMWKEEKHRITHTQTQTPTVLSTEKLQTKEKDWALRI